MMTDIEIVPGDVVRLKTSDLRMTVGDVQGGEATCYWMADEQLSVDKIATHALVKLKRRPKVDTGTASGVARAAE